LRAGDVPETGEQKYYLQQFPVCGAPFRFGMVKMIIAGLSPAIPNSKKITVQPKNGQRYGLVKQYKTVPAAI
jgi:hypothetical protein